MKARFLLTAGLALAGLGLCLHGQEKQEKKPDEEAYQKLMQAAGATVGDIKKNLEGDLPAVAAGAKRLNETFDEVQSFWINRDLEEPEEWSGDVMDAADALGEAASKGDRAATQAAFKNLTGVCAQCHNTYREKDPNGGYRIRAK
jgi:cytochrome c556